MTGSRRIIDGGVIKNTAVKCEIRGIIIKGDCCFFERSLRVVGPKGVCYESL